MFDTEHKTCLVGRRVLWQRIESPFQRQRRVIDLPFILLSSPSPSLIRADWVNGYCRGGTGPRRNRCARMRSLEGPPPPRGDQPTTRPGLLLRAVRDWLTGDRLGEATQPFIRQTASNIHPRSTGGGTLGG